MQHGSTFALDGGDALGQRSAVHQPGGMVAVVLGVHLPAHDLAAVQVKDQVQVEPLSGHPRGQERISQHHTWRGAVATCVCGARLAWGALALPRCRFCPAARRMRLKLDSLAR